MIWRDIAFDLYPYLSKKIAEPNTTANASSVSLEVNGLQESFQENDACPGVSGTAATSAESTNLRQLQEMTEGTSQGKHERKSVDIDAVKTASTPVTEKSIQESVATEPLSTLEATDFIQNPIVDEFAVTTGVSSGLEKVQMSVII